MTLEVLQPPLRIPLDEIITEERPFAVYNAIMALGFIKQHSEESPLVIIQPGDLDALLAVADLANAGLVRMVMVENDGLKTLTATLLTTEKLQAVFG